MTRLLGSRLSAAAVAAIALVCLGRLAVTPASAGSPLSANALRLAALEAELNAPDDAVDDAMLVDLSAHAQFDAEALIAEHVREGDRAMAFDMIAAESDFLHMSEEDRHAAIEASLAEVEAAEREGRPVAESSLLQASETPTGTATNATSPVASTYWGNPYHRRSWCDKMRFGGQWVEQHAHWRAICAPIEKFRPYGFFSAFCHIIHADKEFGQFYKYDPFWKKNCGLIRNPAYTADKPHHWRWHPGHKRHELSVWCEKYGHKFRDLTNTQYNAYCYGREAPKGYRRGYWDVDPQATEQEQANYWWCRAYRSYEDTWKTSATGDYKAKCTKGEGARGAKHPGFEPAMTPAEIDAVKMKAAAAKTSAIAKASEPVWIWNAKIDRTKDSRWCEKNGLIASSDPRYIRACEGNRETDEQRKARIERAGQRAEKEALARIPYAEHYAIPSAADCAVGAAGDNCRAEVEAALAAEAKRAAMGLASKNAQEGEVTEQLKPTDHLGASPILQARAEATLEKIESTLTTEQKAALEAKVTKAKEALTASLPANTTQEEIDAMVKSIKISAMVGEEPTATASSTSTDAAKPAELPPPTLPELPAAVPKMPKLHALAAKLRDRTFAHKNNAITGTGAAGASGGTSGAAASLAGLTGVGPNMQRGPNGQPMIGPNGQPMIGPNGQPLPMNPALANAVNGVAQAQLNAMNAMNGAPALGPNGQPLAGASATGAMPPMVGSNGQPMVGPDGKPLLMPRVPPMAPAAPAKPLTLEEQWANEDAERLKARQAKLAKEDEDERKEIAAEKQAKIDAEKKRLAAEQQATGTGLAGETKDWNKKFQAPSLPTPPPAQPFVSKVAEPLSAAAARAAGLAPGATPGGCLGCRNAGKKQHLPIVLDPTSINELDIPLMQELHRRVDYLIEPQAKKLNLEEELLRSAAKQARDAEEHHIRIYDFTEKYKNDLLIPKRIQDEQNEVQLE